MWLCFRVHLLVIASALACPGLLQAQTTVYKCANRYSQTPCPDGQQLRVDDSRTAAQKQGADAATAQQAKLGQSLEKERQAQQAQQARALAKQNAGQATKPAIAKTEPPKPPATIIAPKRPQTKPNKPDQFVADVPGTRPDKTSKKKTSKRTD